MTLRLGSNIGHPIQRPDARVPSFEQLRFREIERNNPKPE